MCHTAYTLTPVLLVPTLRLYAVEITSALGTFDPWDLPLYSRTEAARLLRVSPSTMEGWVTTKVRDQGERVSKPVIRIPEGYGSRLSFNNLIEAYVLKLLRAKHEISMPAVRRAIAFAEDKLTVDRLLLRPELRFGQAGDLFWDTYGELTNLSQGGQLVLRKIVEEGLRRVEWDDQTGMPIRFFPDVEGLASMSRTVVIDPQIAFGKPTIVGKGVATSAVADRVRAGEDVNAVAEDYGIDLDLLIDALAYEKVS